MGEVFSLFITNLDDLVCSSAAGKLILWICLLGFIESDSGQFHAEHFVLYVLSCYCVSRWCEKGFYVQVILKLFIKLI